MATAITDRTERRAAILQAARATLAEKGLEATKVSETAAVVVDATIIRTLLVPATMRMLGR